MDISDLSDHGGSEYGESSSGGEGWLSSSSSLFGGEDDDDDDFFTDSSLRDSDSGSLDSEESSGSDVSRALSFNVLEWRDLAVSMDSKQLLAPVSGHAMGGRLMAVMGGLFRHLLYVSCLRMDVMKTKRG